MSMQPDNTEHIILKTSPKPNTGSKSAGEEIRNDFVANIWSNSKSKEFFTSQQDLQSKKELDYQQQRAVLPHFDNLQQSPNLQRASLHHIHQQQGLLYAHINQDERDVSLSQQQQHLRAHQQSQTSLTKPNITQQTRPQYFLQSDSRQQQHPSAENNCSATGHVIQQQQHRLQQPPPHHSGLHQVATEISKSASLENISRQGRLQESTNCAGPAAAATSKEVAEGIQQELAKIQEIVESHTPHYNGPSSSEFFSSRHPAAANWYYPRDLPQNRNQYPYYGGSYSAEMMMPAVGFTGGWSAVPGQNYPCMAKPNHSKFPESPPDSGSEPYSPPETLINPKANPNQAVQSLNPLAPNCQQPAKVAQFNSPYYHGYPPPNLPHPYPAANHPQHSTYLSSMPSFALHHCGPRPSLENLMPSETVQTCKRRKLTCSPSSSNRASVKVEPEPQEFQYRHQRVRAEHSEDESQTADLASDGMVDGVYKVITWSSHEQDQWVTLADESGRTILPLNLRVDADKGFNYTTLDEAFVCQKKNHFQITTHVITSVKPAFVKGEGLEKIDAFYLHFHGVKAESPNQRIKVEQSQSDRSKKTFNPVRIDIRPDEMNKLTVGRLHFSETTLNNMRKKGKPNPDQRYFQLVVRLEAHCASNLYTVVAHVSEKIIVRASNPGQFETDVEVIWNRGKSSDVIYHVGKVGINTENPEEVLTVHGNMRITGHIVAPSDMRIKKDITELDTGESLRNIQQMRLYKYRYRDEYADMVGDREEGDGEGTAEAGVLAQEVMRFLPDAVRETGSVTLPSGEVIDRFLVVNKERIFFENVGAVRELARVTDQLDSRICEMESLKQRIFKYLRSKRDSFFSYTSSNSSQISSVSQPRQVAIPTISEKFKEKQKEMTINKNRCYANNQSDQSEFFLATPLNSRPPISDEQRHFCSNRWMQLFVIVLVLIMATCVVSITVLYIIDRNANHAKSGKINIDQRTTKQDLRPSYTASGKPLLPSHCLTHPIDCPVICCDPRLDDPGFGYIGSHFVTHPHLPHPSHYPHKPHKFPKGKSTKSINDVNFDIEEEEEDVIYEIDINRTKKRKNFPHQHTNKETRSKRGAAVTEKLSISLVQLNQTLSDDYCSSADCIGRSGMNFSYSIPISENFPATFLTIKFGHDSIEDKDLVLVLCDQMKTSFCISQPENNVFKSTKVTNMSWDLPVGFYMISKFSFRVGPMTETVCDSPLSNLSSSVSLYELNFHRVCAL